MSSISEKGVFFMLFGTALEAYAQPTYGVTALYTEHFADALLKMS